MAGMRAVAPLLRNGSWWAPRSKHKHPDGADADRVEDVEARYVAIADGSNSRFGWALGTSRNKNYPQGMAIRTYFESPLHAEPWIESALDVRDRNGNSLPGYGWISPCR